MSTQTDAASGVHPGPTCGPVAGSREADARWSPYRRRPGNAFDDLYARLTPEIARTIGQYEQKRSALIPLAQLFQDHEGFVSADAIAAIAYHVGETLATVESTISFYTLLYRKPVGKYMVQICRNLSCMLNGADEIMAYAREQLGVDHLQTTADGLISYEEVECLAACDRAPCAQVNLEFVYDLTRESVDAMIAAIRAGNYPVKPLAQTVTPGRRWKVEQDTGRKAPGATNVSSPNNAGGIGDPSGIAMFDLIVGRPKYEARSNERLVRETNLRPELSENGHH
ncbi:MAG: NAD(P)H-dependent oxidoreductase subunit E [Candidatus Eremiobacteraeota bacterium]|nr:NAD(P)H-dependent oxidoreductase subunit E [Candidatus Eremiobacteraeota bacterium]